MPLFGGAFNNLNRTQQPQENQYLQGNPVTEPNANTSWMGSSGSISQPKQPSQPSSPTSVSQNQGTMLGSVSSGAAPQYQYMEGVDTGKLNDPSHTTPKYVASRILASGGSLEDAARAVGAKVLDKTKMLLNGEVIDTRRDEEGANALQWLVERGSDGRDSNGNPIQQQANGQPQFLQGLLQQVWNMIKGGGADRTNPGNLRTQPYYGFNQDQSQTSVNDIGSFLGGSSGKVPGGMTGIAHPDVIKANMDQYNSRPRGGLLGLRR